MGHHDLAPLSTNILNLCTARWEQRAHRPMPRHTASLLPANPDPCERCPLLGPCDTLATPVILEANNERQSAPTSPTWWVAVRYRNLERAAARLTPRP